MMFLGKILFLRRKNISKFELCLGSALKNVHFLSSNLPQALVRHASPTRHNKLPRRRQLQKRIQRSCGSSCAPDFVLTAMVGTVGNRHELRSGKSTMFQWVHHRSLTQLSKLPMAASSRSVKKYQRVFTKYTYIYIYIVQYGKAKHTPPPNCLLIAPED